MTSLSRLSPPFAPGTVWLVGAGPGDPGLLTIHALNALAAADAIVYDALVDPAVLALAREGAILEFAGKRGGKPSAVQRDICERLIQLAREGKRVLRLKGGDPFIFGRGGEELDYLKRLNIKVVVVPGITAALGCAAAAGIPLTHRDRASSVAFVTGHQRDGADTVDWRALAKPDNTIIVYMGLSHAGVVQERLLEAGLAPTTPIAIVERGTTPEQRISYGTLDRLGRIAADHRHGRPALLIIGEVVALGEGWGHQELLQEAVSW